MAKYDITYSCGHSATIQLYGKNEEREKKIKWFESEGLCPDCYREYKREEDARKAAEILQTTAIKLPEITGKSEKQIKFANDKRNEAITRLKEYPRSYRFVCDYFAGDEKVKNAIKKIAEERYNGDVLRAIAVEYTKEASALIEIKNESDAGYILAALFDEKRNVHEI